MNPSNEIKVPTDNLSDDGGVSSLLEGMGVDRRDFFDKSGKLLIAMAFARLTAACKTVGKVGGKLAGAPIGDSFLGDIAAAEAATPLTAPTDSAFPLAAKARGDEVAKVVGNWLRFNPYGMFTELLSKSESDVPVFKPMVGPVIVFRHGQVIESLLNTSALTVDPYGVKMKGATEGASDPSKPDYFMLGTDNPAQYAPDSRVLRHVMGRADVPRLRSTLRGMIDSQINASKRRTPGEIDMVQTLARFVPVGLAGEYLGVPTYDSKTTSFDGILKGGQSFPIDEELKKTFKFTAIDQGKIPTPADLYSWVRDSFRDTFNNVKNDPSFMRDARVAIELQVAYIHKIIKHYKVLIIKGDQKHVPDNMLTRLIRLQLGIADGTIKPESLGFGSKQEAAARLTDARIRENVNGTVTGAIANPEEANARIVSQAIKFRMKQIEVVAGEPAYDHYVGLARENFEDDKKARGPSDLNMKDLNTLALELLRLTPQGEVLLRQCVTPVTIGGQTLNPQLNKIVFVAHGAAMRDPNVVSEPEKISVKRDKLERPFAEAGDPRAGESPQSALYLQHGYGRHKCLGRYVSELTMEELLRAVLLLKNPTIKRDITMDVFGLYAESLLVGYDA